MKGFKNFKDVAHLLVGCRIVYDRVPQAPGVLIGVRQDGVKTSLLIMNVHGSVSEYSSSTALKPILRPFSSITTKEVKEIFRICYKSIYGHGPKLEKEELLVDSTTGYGCIGYEDNGKWRYGLSIEEGGVVMFSVNGRDMQIPHFEIMVYLLSRYFNLFDPKWKWSIDANTLQVNPYTNQKAAGYSPSTVRKYIKVVASNKDA